MKSRIRVLAAIGALVLLIVLGLVCYFSWLNIAYVDTLHARVVGSLVQVSAPGMSRVIDLPVEVGDSVVENEELGILELVGLGTGQASATRILIPVRAPLSGVVVDKATRVSDILSAGQSIVTLLDPQRLWVEAGVHETRIPQVHVGQPVRIRVRTRSLRRTFWGRVEQIGGATSSALIAGPRGTNAASARLNEVPVRISVDPAGYDLYPGMTAEVRIKLSPRLW